MASQMPFALLEAFCDDDEEVIDADEVMMADLPDLAISTEVRGVVAVESDIVMDSWEWFGLVVVLERRTRCRSGSGSCE